MTIQKEEIAYFIGKVMGDGNLDSSFTCRFIGQEEDLIKLSKIIKNRFNISKNRLKIYKREAYGISYLLQINYANFGKLLYKHGAPIGNKTKQEFLTPNWIYKNKKFKRRFLQAILEDELSTIKIKKRNHANCPNFKLQKSIILLDNLMVFLLQIKNMLKTFDIESSHICETRESYKQKDGTYTKGCFFWIQMNKENIIRFKENIGFRLNSNKIYQLNKCYTQLKKSLS